MEIRKIKPEELLDADKAVAVCFEFPMDKEDAAMTPEAYYNKRMGARENARLRDDIDFMERYAAFEDGLPVSEIFAISYKMWFDGNIMPMTGIGGVLTMPSHRRKGHIKGIMKTILNELYDRQEAFSYLYPFSQRYYEMFGFARSDPAAEYTIPMEFLNAAKGRFTARLYDNSFDIGAFQTAYGAMTGYNTMLARERHDFVRLYKADPYSASSYAYAYMDENGVPRGYLIFSKLIENNESVMDVSELVFDSYETLRGLMAFAAGFAADYSEIRFTAPFALPLEGICTDYSQAEAKRKLIGNGMVRVIYPKSVLESSRYDGSGSCTLEIIDAFLEKTHRLHVTFEDGAATEVAETKSPPDCTMDIGTFAQAIIGRYSWDDMAFLGFKSNDVLRRVFYRKPIFINNRF